MRAFFGIEENYTFEWCDLSALLTILNVTLVLCGVAFAPLIGIINSAISLIVLVLNKGHINAYALNLALIVLNTYFLVG